ncbi:hypothetical protein LUZ62_001271 [Rhynchospora pubera]|uniref:Uncharacterized protein n=1 Tax=Rhynchospora pubera TaxID=906938 RepID=A0AAV8BNV4_9POAL|nr:hypothetical protein LUZ62_001271 [Rhynchospora pubera]
MSSHFLAKRLPSSLRQHLLTPLLRLPFSTQSNEKEIPFHAKYLIPSLGFSPERAFKVSNNKYFAGFKSDEQPVSVIKFLRDTGLSDDQIKGVVSFYPPFLSFNVEKTLKPKVRELMDAGFSGELLLHLIRYNPSALLRKETLSHVQFCRDFAGNNDEVLLKIIKVNGLIITYDIQTYVGPRINLFKEYGLSNQDIVRALVFKYSSCMSKRLDSLKHVLDFIEEAGVPRKSGMFLPCFRSICGYSKDTIESKMEFFKSTYGWSQEEVYSAFKKFPTVLAISKDKVKSNMNFLTREAKMEPRSIASYPHLLAYSQQKRLVPRLHVLRILATKGLKNSVALTSACVLTEKRFIEKYVEPYKKDVPELAEAYCATCGGNIPV